MKYFSYHQMTKFFFLISLILYMGACTKEEVNEPTVTKVPDDTETQIKDFVWHAMNSWYLYEAEVSDLDDKKDDDIPGYVSFLQSFSNPEALFDDLIYKKNIKDRFSFIVDDYEKLENELQGISESFGYDFQLLLTSEGSNDLIGYVRYVLPDSPAENAGIKRGDLFTKVDGKQLTTQNYRSLLFDRKSYTLGLVKYEKKQFVSDRSIEMDAVIIHENPVFLAQTMELSGGRKAGYLVYNEFNYLYHEELYNAFVKFREDGIKDLILDLRYNPGGSVITAAMLASMIYTTDTKKRFIKLAHNEKHESQDSPLEFLDQVLVLNSDYEITANIPMQSLQLPRLFVITSSGTASASEAVINGLNPYMDVVIVGDRTVGKNVGSRTLYDSPASDFTNKAQANPAHKYALQPLTSKIVNSIGFGDYEDGFAPDVKILERDYVLDMKPLGDPDEPLLHAALELIKPTRSGQLILASKYDGPSFIAGPERKSQHPFFQILNVEIPD